MREQLIQYVELLFAGATDSDEIRQEILQNTLDRFDDLVEQGKSPEAAYRLAISGIGDINEILGNPVTPAQTKSVAAPAVETAEDKKRKKIRAVAIAMYILCAIPLILFSEILGWDIIGLCLTLAIVAVATYLMIITGKDDEDDDDKKKEPEHPLKERIGDIIWVAGLIIYFLLSFATSAWNITWLLFPIMACARGLSDAIIDLKEGR